MTDTSGRFGAFMGEDVPVKRWRLYSLRFIVMSLGLIGFQAVVDGRMHRGWLAIPIMAALVIIFDFITDLRKASG